MHIKEINIKNFKRFKGTFNLKLKEGLNILVGDNEAGKSTILEAIHLGLTGLFNGRYLKNELTQYLFNNEIVAEYVKKVNDKNQQSDAVLPCIQVEIFFSGDNFPVLEGDGNTNRKKECGISYRIAFNDRYQPEYEELVRAGNIKTIPIEYYDIFWTSFARDSITARDMPIKSALIDSSSNRYQNGSDVYISRIIKDFLEPEDVVSISQAHRKMRDVFMDDDAIRGINAKIKDTTNISNKVVKLSVDLSTKNAWESSLMTYLDDVPFHHVGKGEQCVVKTRLALSHKKAQEASIIFLEEPENHLSHTKLNQLIREIKDNNDGKQIIISTHNSFVANKLGLENLILLNDEKTVRFDDLLPETKSFFERLAGYDTLRLILCKKAVLVEGDSDELIIQKAFRVSNGGKLPIEKGVDVISVGTSFLRFLEIAERIKKPVIVVTDNDGEPEDVKKKYAGYLGKNSKEFIKIIFDETVDTGNLEVEGKRFNYNTLEPKLLKENNLGNLNKIFKTNYAAEDDLHKYMRTHKTECALKIFDTSKALKFPQYIMDAINAL